MTSVISLVLLLVHAISLDSTMLLDSEHHAAGKLWSTYELQLQDAVFQTMESHERTRRTSLVPNIWTGFVPNLHQHREQLVIDSLRIVNSTSICSEAFSGGTGLMESIHYHRRNYIAVACGDLLFLYDVVNSSAIQPLDNKRLTDQAVSSTHFRLFDPESGEVLLFVLVLTARSLEVYQIYNNSLQYSTDHKLLHEHRDVKVFYANDAVFCILVKKPATGQIRSGMYKLELSNGNVNFDLVVSASLPGESMIQTCDVDGQSHLFHPDILKGRLDIYIIDGRQFEYRQFIEARNVKDFKCFSIGATHFLAFYTSQILKIFRYDRGFYDELQSFSLQGVSTIHPLSPPTYRDDTFLLINGFKDDNFIDLLVFDATTLTFRLLNSTCSEKDKLMTFPSKLKPADISCLAAISGALNMSLLASFVVDQQLLIVVPMKSEVWVITVDVHLELVENPLARQLVRVQERIEATVAAAQKVNARSNEFLEFSKGIVLYESDVKLEGSWKTGTVSVPEVLLENLNKTQVDFNPEIWIPGLDVIVDNIQKEIAELQQMLDDIDSRLQGTVQNGSADPIEFSQLSVDGSLFLKQLEVAKLSIEKLNGEDLSAVMNDVVRMDTDKMIESLNVMGTLAADALTADLVNGILVKDVVVGSGEDLKITGNLNIRGNVSVLSDIVVGETLNRINLTQVATSKDLHDTIVFAGNTNVSYLSVEEFLNGIDVSGLLNNAVINQTIDALLDRVHFDDLVIDGDLEIKSGVVNDINITAMNARTLRIDTDEIVEGTLVFTQGVGAQKDLKVGTVNGIKFEDLLGKNMNLSDFVLTGQKVFLGNVTSRVLNIGSVVNGHHLTKALTHNSNQTVTGTVHLLNGFNVPTADLSIGTVNEVDWEAVHEKGVHPALLKQCGIGKNVIIRNLCSINGSLIAVHLNINGENLDTVLGDIVYATGGEIVVTGEKNFSSLKMNGLQVDGYINGLKVLDDILTSSTDQTIIGNYKFEDFVDFSSLDVEGHLNQYKLDEMLGSILQFDEDLESVTCRLRFNQVSVSDRILINGSINGFSTKQMLLDNADQTFSAPQKLVMPDFSLLSIEGSLNMTDHTSHINGMDLDLFDRRRVTISTDQWIKGAWKLNNLTADSLSFLTLNGLTSNQWNSSFIHSHSRSVQTIEAKGFELDNLKVWGDITTSSKEINGYNLQDLSEVAGDVRKNLVFNTSVTFSNLESKEAPVCGIVNNHSIEQLQHDVVYRNQTLRMAGTKTFQKLTVKENVDVELINGHRLIDSYLHVSADQRIDSPIQFAGAVTAGDLKLIGNSATLNGVPNQLLFSSHTLNHNSHRGDVIFEQPIKVDSLEISSLHGENWQRLISSLARLNETNELNGTITITEPVKFEGALTVGILNGIDIKNFTEDVVLVDADASITSKKILYNVETPSVSTHGLTCDSVYPDVIGTALQAIRLDIDEVVNRTVYFDKVEAISNVKSAMLNGLSFPADFVTLDGDQELFNYMVVDKVVINGNITLEDEARVNGFDLNAECANTWMIDGNEEIKSNKIFLGPVTILGNLTTTQKVNGIVDFAKEVITLSNGGTIYGCPILADLAVHGEVINVELTNDVDFTDLAVRALYLDQPINSNGTWNVLKATVHGGSFLLPIEAKINEQSAVGKLIGEIDSNEAILSQLEERKVYDITQQWYGALRHAFYKFDHFDLNQTIVLPHQITALSEMQLNGTSLLFIGTRGGSMVYRRKSNESSYSLAGIPPETGNVTKWLTLPPNYATSLSTSGTKLWHISSFDPFVLREVQDFGTDVVDITDEAIHNLRPNFSGNASRTNSTVASTPELQIYERFKTPDEFSSISSSFNSDVKMHNFHMGSKPMIGLIMTFSANVLANVVGCPGVRLYSTSAASWKLEHIIPACDVRAIATCSHGNFPDHFLILAEHESVTVYRYEGASGFVVHSNLPYNSANALLSWSVKSQSDSDLLLAVAKSDRLAIHRSVTVGDYVKV